MVQGSGSFREEGLGFTGLVLLNKAKKATSQEGRLNSLSSMASLPLESQAFLLLPSVQGCLGGACGFKGSI